MSRVRVDLPVAIPPVTPIILTFSNFRLIPNATRQGIKTATIGLISLNILLATKYYIYFHLHLL